MGELPRNAENEAVVWVWSDGTTSTTEEVWAYEMAFARIPWWRRLFGERPPRSDRSPDV